MVNHYRFTDYKAVVLIFTDQQLSAGLSVRHVGGMFLGFSHDSHPKGAEPQRFPTFRVLLYLCLYPFTQNDQIRRGNTYRDGHILGSQSRHCINIAQKGRAVCQRQLSFVSNTAMDWYKIGMYIVQLDDFFCVILSGEPVFTELANVRIRAAKEK